MNNSLSTFAYYEVCLAHLLLNLTCLAHQEQQQLQALIVEKKMEFERLRIEFESLQKAETEQLEFIEQLILQS